MPSSGARLGPYEVLSPLGAGGMGEVYRARDTKLRRDVALKVLPEAFTSDPDQLGLGALGNVTSETLRAFDEGEFKKTVAAIP